MINIVIYCISRALTPYHLILVRIQVVETLVSRYSCLRASTAGVYSLTTRHSGGIIKTQEEKETKILSHHTRMSAEQCESLESVLEKYVPQPELAEVKRILYGKPVKYINLNSKSDGKMCKMNQKGSWSYPRPPLAGPGMRITRWLAGG